MEVLKQLVFIWRLSDTGFAFSGESLLEKENHSIIIIIGI